MKDAAEIMERKGVKPTSNRILVLNALLRAEHPVSLTELDAIIQTMDKSSIFRALGVFLDGDIVHGIEDGSGSLKYEVCHADEHCTIADMHVHFYCEECRTTFCLESLPVPEVALPEGFVAHAVNYMVKGLCPRCGKRKSAY